MAEVVDGFNRSRRRVLMMSLSKVMMPLLLRVVQSTRRFPIKSISWMTSSISARGRASCSSPPRYIAPWSRAQGKHQEAVVSGCTDLTLPDLACL